MFLQSAPLLSEAAFTTRPLGINNLGVKIGEGYTDYSQGPMKGTENVFDLALSGPGFFAVSYTNRNNETSIKYTRDGSFTMDTQGYLKTHDGDFVLNRTGGRIRLDPLLDVRIDTSGNIMQGESTVPVTQLQIRDLGYLRLYLHLSAVHSCRLRQTINS